MKAKRRMLGAAAALLVATATAVAQQVAAPPILRDLTEQQTLPSDGTFDIMGLRLGSTREELNAKLQALAPDARINESKSNVEMRDDRGNSIKFLYVSMASVLFRQPDTTQENIEAIFTTRINGERAVRITRRITYPSDRQGSLPALLSDLNAKYGPPSFQRNGRITNVHYVWFKGKRTTLTPKEEEAQRFIKGTPGNCLASRAEQYVFLSDRREDNPGCTTHMQVTINLGTRDDLIASMQIHLMDVTRRVQNAHDTDAWISKELERVAKEQSGTRSKL